jgi:hypothetical protein
MLSVSGVRGNGVKVYTKNAPGFLLAPIPSLQSGDLATSRPVHARFHSQSASDKEGNKWEAGRQRGGITFFMAGAIIYGTGNSLICNR